MHVKLKIAWLLLTVFGLSNLAAAQNRARCFECIDVPYPSLCTTLTECPNNYKCSMEKIVTSGGLILFNSGCQSDTKCSANRKRGIPQHTLSRSLSPTDNVTCSECCDGEFCNNAGCGQTALPRTQRGPLCFSCKFENNPQHCRTIRRCDIGQICMLTEVPTSSSFGGAVFSTSCQSPQVCGGYASLIGKKRASHCHVCCQDDFCNDRCPTTSKRFAFMPPPTSEMMNKTEEKLSSQTTSPFVTPSSSMQKATFIMNQSTSILSTLNTTANAITSSTFMPMSTNMEMSTKSNQNATTSENTAFGLPMSSTVNSTGEITKVNTTLPLVSTAKITSPTVTQTAENLTTELPTSSLITSSTEQTLSMASISTTVSYNATRCYECIDVPHPADCTLATMCPVGQTCVVEEIVTSDGLVLFNSGCQSRWKCDMKKRRRRDIEPSYSSISRRSDITTCIECCEGDFCNDMGCGQEVLSRDQRGPLCFHCDVASGPDTCRHVAKCDVGDVCMLTELDYTSPGGDPLFRSDCVTPTSCRDIGLQKKKPQACHVCCDDDYCNDQCRSVVGANMTSTSAATPLGTTSTTSTSTTQHVTTTKITTTETTPTTTARSTTTQKLTLRDKCKDHNYTYNEHNHLCYKFHYTHMTWKSGNAACKHEGGTMAILDNRQQLEYLRDSVMQEERYHHRNVYIGGKYAGNGHFNWADGSRVRFFDWAPDEPSSKDDFCIHLSKEDTYRWHDTSCQTEYLFICTIRL